MITPLDLTTVCTWPEGVSQLINSSPWEAQLEKHKTESKPKTSPGTPAHGHVISAAILLSPEANLSLPPLSPDVFQTSA